jgi:hypothetical protein
MHLFKFKNFFTHLDTIPSTIAASTYTFEREHLRQSIAVLMYYLVCVCQCSAVEFFQLLVVLSYVYNLLTKKSTQKPNHGTEQVSNQHMKLLIFHTDFIQH